MNTCELVSNGFHLLLHLLPLHENFIQLRFQFFILILYMSVSIFDIFRSCVDSQLIKSYIIISKSSLKIPDFLSEFISPRLQLIVELLLFIDLLCLFLKILCFLLNALNLELFTMSFSLILFT